MLGGFIPTITDERGWPVSVSLFMYSCSTDLEELKPIAQQQARENNRRQFITIMNNWYVLFDEWAKDLPYFQGQPIVARFARSGKETTPKEK